MAKTVLIFLLLSAALHAGPGGGVRLPAVANPITLNRKATGYRGIWYMNQPSRDKYVYKYSGGLGTYCAKHQPFAVYCPEVDRTYFCYGGAVAGADRRLLHMVSYYDHRTGGVPRPTILLDKHTGDAHDNPVISVDGQGYLWIFSTSHGTGRPSYIHRSCRPWSIDGFELVLATRVGEKGPLAIDNFSYMQAWHRRGRGFFCFFTRYRWPAGRTLCWMTSADGLRWSRWQRLAAIAKGHYQISQCGPTKVATAFNYHPRPRGLNWRTNLYYLESADFGHSWQSASGISLVPPLRKAVNPALVRDYEKEGLKVYLKDIAFDPEERPVILYVTSKGYQAGPANDPRTWTTARWNGQAWLIRPCFTSDNNYDMGSLYLEQSGTWRIIAPARTGPQPYNPGGEVSMWVSSDRGLSWQRTKDLTSGSARNHTYIRRPVKAHPDFYAIWADGHGRRPSPSDLHFCDRSGTVYRLPRHIPGDYAKPEKLP